MSTENLQNESTKKKNIFKKIIDFIFSFFRFIIVDVIWGSIFYFLMYRFVVCAIIYRLLVHTIILGFFRWIFKDRFKLNLKIDPDKNTFLKILLYLYKFTIYVILSALRGIGQEIVHLLTLFFNQDWLSVVKRFETYKGEEIPEVEIDEDGNHNKKQLRKASRMQNQRRRIEKYETWDEKDTSAFLLNNAIYIVILTLILIIIIISPNFLQLAVLEKILSQSAVRIILAFGVGGIIILQGTDLSLGRNVGMAAIITASLLQADWYPNRFYESLPQLPLILPLVIAMIVSAFFSGINGLVVAKFKVHPFLATLGSSVALFGILSMYFDSGDAPGQPIGGLSETLVEFVNGDILGIPNLIIYAILATVVVWIIWNKTTFGKNMFAVGGNPEAANISGVNVLKTTVMVYILAGLLYGLGGFLEAGRIGSVSNTTGANYELDAIAACVVGGISFSGGVGKVSGAITGVLMFTIIVYGMQFIGLEVFYQYIVKGVIIVVAVALDTRKYILKT